MTETKQKYIIRNCPCAKWRMGQPSRVFCIEDEEYKTLCKNVENCTIKQIVEKCEDAQSECSCKDPIKDVDCFECTSGGIAELGTEILQLFDIEVLNDRD
ncbi:MAG: hypothetical protein II306_06390 [Clostridia bacterium]|nr:hypothetical protein [Clostridia bacterium]